MNKTRALTHVISLCGALTAVLIVYAVLHSTGIYSFTSRETEGLNTLILLLGSIYAVMFAFVIFVIWGQFSEVEALCAREQCAERAPPSCNFHVSRCTARASPDTDGIQRESVANGRVSPVAGAEKRCGAGRAPHTAEGGGL